MTANLIASELKIRRLFLVEKSDHNQLLLNVTKEQCRSSYKELFSLYAPKLYRYAMANQLNETQSSDLVQEVMTKVWLKAHLFNHNKGDASTWIFTLARNIRFDLLRKNVRDNNIITSDDLWCDTPNDHIDQDADLEYLQEKKELRTLVEQLPNDQKDVITQIYFTGHTQEEYSEKHNIPLGTVKSRIRLAIRKLNILMEKS